MKITKNFREKGWIKFNLTREEVEHFTNGEYIFSNDTILKDIDLFWNIFAFSYKNRDKKWNILLEGGAIKILKRKAIVCSEEIMLSEPPNVY